jgi:hypothetical protein
MPQMVPRISTYTGKRVNPLNLKPEDIDIKDIAHHLACQNRFVGALKRPINIAQHSIYVSRLVSDYGSGLEREALFHDATEAYLGDVSKWVKLSPAMAAYRKAEDNAHRVICEALGLSPTLPLPDQINEADKLMVRYEAMMQMRNPRHMFEIPGYERPTPTEITLIGDWSPWGWRKSERMFLDRVEELGMVI